MNRTRATRTAIAVVLGLAATLSAKAARPGNVFACYCTTPDSVAEYVNEPNVVIVAGTLTGAASFRVERVYRGPIALGPNDILVDSSSCGFPMVKGERWILAARMFKGELRPSICDSRARVGGPGAAPLLADIAAVFGPQAPLDDPPEAGATAPPQPAPLASVTVTTAQPAPAGATNSEVALPAILAAVLAVVATLFGGVAIVARRDRGRT